MTHSLRKLPPEDSLWERLGPPVWLTCLREG